MESWLPLATLVRLPTLSKIKCPAAADAACTLSGSALFLIDSLSSDPQFSRAVQVPDGFPGYSIPVPRPADGKIYMKLRDDPDIVNSVALAVQTDAATAAAAPPSAATNTATPDGAVKPQ